MTERKPMEPVACVTHTSLNGLLAGNNVVCYPNEYFQDGDVALYTTSQIRSLVEEVRAEYAPEDNETALAGAIDVVLDAILARLEK